MTIGTSTVGGRAPEPTRDELRRRNRETFAMGSGLPELKRSDLRFDRFAVVHEPTGNQYRVYTGEIGTGPTHPCSAWFFAQDGSVEFLEAVNAKARA